ncbi:MBL fold metallo-hydrolase [Haloarchaeobius baliensis]|uniref:MBL fold metallo-hydrolase n=1 Tax=Haloarchaeobius baliensis TaxID=1670458 RepID=UPI003F883CB0
MEVSFQHANPHSGAESVLLRFRGDVTDQTACILVDAGTGVDVDSLLGTDEYLTAVLLTHAHLDHYATLGENLRDGAPVYASEPTAAILDDVLSEASSNYDISDVDRVRDALEPVDDWTTVMGEIGIRPVPAGHAPGAAGFLLRFEDAGDRETVLATGDWTRREVAGFPGLPLSPSPSALLLTGATDDRFEDTLTDAIESILARTRAGSSVLVTASGLAGVHVATLLSALEDELDVPAVTLVGHAAKLYETLGYDHETVTTVPTYSEPTGLVEPGTVTIAGPEVPVEGSSKRLFDLVADDPGATLVQLTSGGVSPVESAGCTVEQYRYSNHPTEETVDELVETMAPRQVVVTHQSGAGLSRYKDRYDSFVWATTDHDEYTLYRDGTWVAPPWVNDHVARRLRSRQYTNGGLDGLTGETDSLPSVSPGEVTSSAEGLAVGGLVDRFQPSDPTPPAEHGEDADGADESGGSTVEPVPNATLTEIRSQLDRLERELVDDDVREECLRARVVDAGDGDVLLRLLDASETQTLDHGEVVTVTVEPGSQ